MKTINLCTISMTKNPQFHDRTKHIAIKYHFIPEQVNINTIHPEYCPIEEMTADLVYKKF